MGLLLRLSEARSSSALLQEHQLLHEVRNLQREGKPAAAEA
jgi:hypothetical protein